MDMTGIRGVGGGHKSENSTQMKKLKKNIWRYRKGVGGSEIEEFHANEEIEELLSYACARFVGSNFCVVLTVSGVEVLGVSEFEEFHANEEIEEKQFIEVSS